MKKIISMLFAATLVFWFISNSNAAKTLKCHTVLNTKADEVKMLKKDPENYIWSEPKFEAISNETGNFLHVDGDLFITKPFILNDSDVYYDHTELTLHEYYYKENLKNFTDYGIDKVFPEWSSKYLGAFNIGIMGFRTD